jgi:hypothetical protein
VVLAPPPPKPPPFALFGRRLAQAWIAFWKFELPPAPPAAPGAPPPPPPGAPPPALGVTPFFSRQLRNAVSDALLEVDDDGVDDGGEDDEEADFVVLVELVVDFDTLGELLHAAASSPTATIATPTLSRRRSVDDVTRRHADRSGVASWCCRRFLMAAIVTPRSVFALRASCGKLQELTGRRGTRGWRTTAVTYPGEVPFWTIVGIRLQLSCGRASEQPASTAAVSNRRVAGAPVSAVHSCARPSSERRGGR